MLKVENETQGEVFHRILEKAFYTFSKAIEDNSYEYANDKEKLSYILDSNEYEYIAESFWVLFKKKYDIDDSFDDFFDSYLEAMRYLYIKCMIPHNLKLDVMYRKAGDFKTTISNGLSCISYFLRKFFLTSGIGKIGFLVILLAVYFSFDYSSRDLQWASDLFLGIAASVSAAMILASINRYIIKKEKQLTRRRQLILNRTNHLTDRTSKNIELFKKQVKEEGLDYIVTFCNINNDLNDYLRRMKDIIGIKTIKEYSFLVNFEMEIFKFSSIVAKKGYFPEYDDVNEIDVEQLKYYVFELTMLMKDFNLELEEFIYDLDKQINKVNKKKIV